MGKNLSRITYLVENFGGSLNTSKNENVSLVSNLY
jgi:hypothetical protein